jgi:hypothetical protein
MSGVGYDVLERSCLRLRRSGAPIALKISRTSAKISSRSMVLRPSELVMFEKLIAVSGIGPKLRCRKRRGSSRAISPARSCAPISRV